MKKSDYGKDFVQALLKNGPMPAGELKAKIMELIPPEKASASYIKFIKWTDSHRACSYTGNHNDPVFSGRLRIAKEVIRYLRKVDFIKIENDTVFLVAR